MTNSLSPSCYPPFGWRPRGDELSVSKSQEGTSGRVSYRSENISANLAETLEAGDLSQAGDVLRSAVAPFLIHPEVVGYRMSGALNLRVSEKVCSGGVIGRVPVRAEGGAVSASK
jgi:hypothetical protein